MWISLVGGSSATAVADSLGHDSERGALAVVQNDCLGTMGSTDIQIPGAVPWTAEGRPVDAAWETHLTGLGTQDSASRYSGNSLFVNVPPAQAVVITSSLDDGATVVSRRTVLVAGSCFTDVTLYPLTRQQAGRL
jgi:hypothetical protein